jgi:hypothetical protein
MTNGNVKLARTTGWFFTLLGTIHCAATPFVIKEPELASLGRDGKDTFTVMFLGTGLAVVWAGVTFLLAAPALRRGETWPRPVLALAAAFLAILSLLCVGPMPANPFAWLSLAGAGLAVFTARSARKSRPVHAAATLPTEVSP